MTGPHTGTQPTQRKRTWQYFSLYSCTASLYPERHFALGKMFLLPSSTPSNHSRLFPFEFLLKFETFTFLRVASRCLVILWSSLKFQWNEEHYASYSAQESCPRSKPIIFLDSLKLYYKNMFSWFGWGSGKWCIITAWLVFIACAIRSCTTFAEVIYQIIATPTGWETDRKSPLATTRPELISNYVITQLHNLWGAYSIRITKNSIHF
jgi:hypothetical protein